MVGNRSRTPGQGHSWGFDSSALRKTRNHEDVGTERQIRRGSQWLADSGATTATVAHGSAGVPSRAERQICAAYR
jgi:hypothetical protein